MVAVIGEIVMLAKWDVGGGGGGVGVVPPVRPEQPDMITSKARIDTTAKFLIEVTCSSC